MDDVNFVFVGVDDSGVSDHVAFFSGIAVNDDVTGADVLVACWDETAPGHGFVLDEFEGCEAAECGFSAGEEVIGDERAAVVIGPDVFVALGFVALEGVDEFGVELEGFWRNDCLFEDVIFNGDEGGGDFGGKN